MAEKESKEIEAAAARVADAYAWMRIEEKKERLAKLDAQMSSPDFWNDAAHAQDVSRKASALRETLEGYADAAALLEDARAAAELAAEDEAFLEEKERSLAALSEMLDRFEVESWFSGEMDGNDAIVSINPGQGGLEAQDWTEMLYRMYMRYAEQKGWKAKPLDVVPGEGIGLDRAVIQIEGRNAYGMLRRQETPSDDVRRRRGAAGDVGRHRSRPQSCGCARGRVPLERPGRPVREHHRFRGASHAYPHGHRGDVPEREKPAAE